MTVSKNITYGTIQVDHENGKIWLNAPECILRIQNIKFNNFSEKFSMIDINSNNANMYPGEISEQKNFGNFLETIITLLVPRISVMNDNEQKKLLNNLILKIKDTLNNDTIK